MKKSKKLLLISGVLAVTTIIKPVFVVLGYYLFIIPGIIMTVAATFFVYYGSLLLLDRGLEGYFNLRFPTLTAFIILLGTGCFLSFILNIPIYQTIKKYANVNIALEEKFEVPNTIAIYSKDYERYGDLCNALCQRLLYSESTQEVLVITDPLVIKHNLTQPVSSYRIEREKNCTNEHVTLKTGLKIVLTNVESRISAGECLVKKSTQLSEADAIFFHDKVNINEDYKFPKRREVFVNYIELLKKSGDLFDVIYRYSKIYAEPFAYPLIFGPIVDGGLNSGLHGSFGFYHTTLGRKYHRSDRNDPINNFKPQMQKLLGATLGRIEPVKYADPQLIRKAIENKLTYNASGLDVMGGYLSGLVKSRAQLTDDDIQLVIAALKDDRITKGWYHLNNFVLLLSRQREVVPEALVQELGNRLLRKKNIKHVSTSIYHLPDGAAANIYPQLKQVINDKKLRNLAWQPVSRLSDAGGKSTPEYIKILEEYEALGSIRGNHLARKMRYVLDGALIGMCRSGVNTLHVKNLLFSLIDKPTYSTNALIIDVLIQMNLTEELKQRYERNESLWKKFQQAIVQKEWANKKGKPFCGSRLER